MPHTILAGVTASVSELKRNPTGTVAAARASRIAILNHNEPAFYCIPAKTWEAMVERLEDIEDNALVDSRANGKVVKVKLVDL
ncbi:type II toxin-antitoxin system Phd/YefM family antitoxin [Burkholderia cepacia]|uniref:type II toxin-antitoxin system Phd/YefM family antitoxin n=1 Tax=Burkholderia TaxID=32008 RepID=UPI000757D199|nr:type II toxin-antitoxin system prevent-host-death family antitoxin [Burkholderia cepacia]KVW82332.1 plasmid stabilization protein [Burkholderia cepacia]KVX66800.1 plasmid stabilization protein [Burkholderia cepacia]